MIALISGLFGLIVGSFLNVVILRHGTRSISGRSGCFSCGGELAWFDLIPVFSWIALSGRCRRCGSAISVQYPLVEAATAALFALLIPPTLSAAASLAIGLALAVLAALMIALLVAIAAYDLRHTIIPDFWAYGFGACALMTALLARTDGDLSLALLAGPVAALPLFILWLVSGGRWMGLGDAKLSLGIGWLLGPVYGVVAVFFAFLIGAAISVGILLPLPHIARALAKAGIVRGPSSASYTMRSEVPFGPFLIASCIFLWSAMLYHIPLPLAL